jgi:hypothetical protein
MPDGRKPEEWLNDREGRGEAGTAPAKRAITRRPAITAAQNFPLPTKPQGTSFGAVRRSMHFFLEHTTLVFSLLYGYVTVLGIINSFSNHRHFIGNSSTHALIGPKLLWRATVELLYVCRDTHSYSCTAKSGAA